MMMIIIGLILLLAQVTSVRINVIVLQTGIFTPFKKEILPATRETSFQTAVPCSPPPPRCDIFLAKKSCIMTALLSHSMYLWTAIM